MHTIQNAHVLILYQIISESYIDTYHSCAPSVVNTHVYYTLTTPNTHVYCTLTTPNTHTYHTKWTYVLQTSQQQPKHGIISNCQRCTTYATTLFEPLTMTVYVFSSSVQNYNMQTHMHKVHVSGCVYASIFP